MKHCVVDASNLLYRARYAAGKDADVDDVLGLGLDISLRSMRKVFDKFGADHAVVCFDHFSWRKAVHPEYKADRKADASADEVLLRESIYGLADEFRMFLTEKTNVTVLWQEGVEADDFVARWCEIHNELGDTSVIISNDSDYRQLVREGIELFDPIRDILFRHDGIFYQDGRKPGKNQPKQRLHGEDWKVKMVKDGSVVTDTPEMLDPKWVVFRKSMLGKDGELGRSAPAGIGDKTLMDSWGRGLNNERLEKVFENKSSLAWEKVLDKFNEDTRQAYYSNLELSDLTRQPPEIRELMDAVIAEAMDAEPKKRVGMALIAFCRKHGLIRVGEEVEHFTTMLSSRYQ